VSDEADFRLDLNPAEDTTILVDARHQLSAWLSGQGLLGPGLHDLLLAAGEATANAYEHSGAVPGADAPAVRISAVVMDGQIRITVSDRGRWKPLASAESSRGRGRILMAALADEFDVQTGPGGTTVSLAKSLPP